ncbi:MAG: hypothetical protein AAGI92_10440 [Pseudomonadota bacterium]
MTRFAALFLSFIALVDAAFAEADGPEAWQVAGIEAGDRLNVRMGPGTDYPVIGSLPPGARALRNLACVPYYTLGDLDALSEAERVALPARWCFIFHAPSGEKGWVAGRFLREDTGVVAGVRTDRRAIGLVNELMDAVIAQESGGPSPLQSPYAEQFFDSAIIPNIDPGWLGADPIIGGQDSQISKLSVRFDPDIPPLRGLYTVRADFENFGQLRTVRFSVREDWRDRTQMHILSFEVDGVTYGQ